MNPYSIPLVAVPVVLSIVASLGENKWMRRGLFVVAIAAFWAILQPHVHWTFSHPFDPNDGGPKVFALLFGWAYGLILVTPIFWVSIGAQAIVKRLRKRQRIAASAKK